VGSGTSTVLNDAEEAGNYNQISYLINDWYSLSFRSSFVSEWNWSNQIESKQPFLFYSKPLSLTCL